MGLYLIFFPACLHVACVVQQKDARQWFAELSVDMEKVFFKIPLSNINMNILKLMSYLLIMSLKFIMSTRLKRFWLKKKMKKHNLARRVDVGYLGSISLFGLGLNRMVNFWFD